MSIVAGYIDKNKNIWIGADSQCTAGSLSRYSSDKLLSYSNWIAGIVGSGRVINAIQQNKDLHVNIKTKKDLLNWVEILRCYLCDIGASDFTCEDAFPDHKFSVLIAFNKSLFIIFGDYQIFKVSNYVAIGSGEDVAYGALCGIDLAKFTLSGSSRIRFAVLSAIKHNVYCGGRVSIKCLLSNGRKM